MSRLWNVIFGIALSTLILALVLLVPRVVVPFIGTYQIPVVRVMSFLGIVLLGTVMVWGGLRFRREALYFRSIRRRGWGRCTACGYDVRGSGARCSECGMDLKRRPWERSGAVSFDMPTSEEQAGE